MRVLVCGSRDFNNELLMEETLNAYTIDTIIEGKARGADKLAGEYAARHGIPVDVYPALWDKHGKAAGPIRNAQMLTEGKPNLVIAFLAKGSIGTANMIKQAKEAKVEVIVVNI